MEQAIAVLEEVKESILNAYVTKTGLSRNRLAKMMDAETWLNANEAMRLGFVDGILFAEDDLDKKPEEEPEEDVPEEKPEENPDEPDEEPEEEPDEPDDPDKKETPCTGIFAEAHGTVVSGEAGAEQKRQDRGRCTAACTSESIEAVRRKSE